MSFVGTPSSLPQDYRLLAHYVGSPTSRDRPGEGKHTAPDSEGGEHPPRHRPIPTMATSRISPSLPPCLAENTPLLSSVVPRASEIVDIVPCAQAEMFWEEAKTLLRYALPVFWTHAFEHSLVIVAVVSIGHISTTALAAATLGFMTAGVTGFSIIQGMANTLDTVLPSAWTSGEPQLVGLWTQRMTILIAMVLAPMLWVWFHAEPILLSLRQEPEIAKLAGAYLKWATPGLPAYAFNCISRRYFQSQGLFTVPTRIILFVAPINILLTFLFVWGPEPVRLGFTGAPIASSISYNLVSIASVIYGVFFVPRTAWHPLTTRAFTKLGFLARLSIGSVGQVASSWWSWELVGLASSFLGPVHLATQSVLISTCSSFYQVPYAMSIATSVRVGNLLGERNAHRAGATVRASFLLIAMLSMLLSYTLATLRHSWGYLFNDDPEVVQMVAAVLPLVALAHILDCGATLIGGVLRARGRQILSATVNMSAYYIVGCPIGFWLTFERDWQLFGLWWGLILAMAYSILIGLNLCLRVDWDREVEKALARLAGDKNYRLGDARA